MDWNEQEAVPARAFPVGANVEVSLFPYTALDRHPGIVIALVGMSQTEPAYPLHNIRLEDGNVRVRVPSSRMQANTAAVARLREQDQMAQTVAMHEEMLDRDNCVNRGGY